METEALKELPACPVETTLTLISDKWKVLILRDLMSVPRCRPGWSIPSPNWVTA